MIREFRRRAMLASALLLTSSLCALSPAPASAQEHGADSLLTVDKYMDFEQVSEPKLSPDGAQIVYTRRWVNKQMDRWDSALWIIGSDGSRNRFLAQTLDVRNTPIQRVDQLDQGLCELRIGHRHPNRPRRGASRREAFHTSPHFSQRQYAFASATLAVVVIDDDRQAGQAVGAFATGAGAELLVARLS